MQHDCFLSQPFTIIIVLWRDVVVAVIVLFLLFIITGVPLFAGIIHLVMLRVFFKEWTISTHRVKHRLHTLDKLIEIPWKEGNFSLWQYFRFQNLGLPSREIVFNEFYLPVYLVKCCFSWLLVVHLHSL